MLRVFIQPLALVWFDFDFGVHSHRCRQPFSPSRRGTAARNSKRNGSRKQTQGGQYKCPTICESSRFRISMRAGISAFKHFVLLSCLRLSLCWYWWYCIQQHMNTCVGTFVPGGSRIGTCNIILTQFCSGFHCGLFRRKYHDDCCSSIHASIYMYVCMHMGRNTRIIGKSHDP